MSIDTLEYARRLEAAGVDRVQAEAHAQAAAELIAGQSATKADVENAILRLESKIDREIARLESRIDGLESKIDRETARLESRIGHLEVATRREIAELENRLIKYMVGQTAATVGLVLAIGGPMMRLFR
jgi:hypothetical protein